MLSLSASCFCFRFTANFLIKLFILYLSPTYNHAHSHSLLPLTWNKYEFIATTLTFLWVQLFLNPIISLRLKVLSLLLYFRVHIKRFLNRTPRHWFHILFTAFPYIISCYTFLAFFFFYTIKSSFLFFSVFYFTLYFCNGKFLRLLFSYFPQTQRKFSSRFNFSSHSLLDSKIRPKISLSLFTLSLKNHWRIGALEGQRLFF